MTPSRGFGDDEKRHREVLAKLEEVLVTLKAVFYRLDNLQIKGTVSASSVQPER